MTEITTYTGSNGVEQKIADLPWKYMDNIVRQIESGKKADKPAGTLAAIKAEMDRRPPPPEAEGAAAPRASDPVRPEHAEIGHNQGPNMDEFTVRLAERLAPLTTRKSALLRQAAAVIEIKTPEQHEAAMTMLREFANLEKDTKAFHEKEKADYKRITDAIDQACLSKGIMGDLSGPKLALQRTDATYLEALDQKRRDDEAAAAKKLRDEAEAAQAAAAEAETAGQHVQAEVLQEGAIAREAVAERKEQAAAAPVGTYGRTTSSAGTASVKVEAKILTVDRDKVDLEALRQFFTDAEVEAAIGKLVKLRGWKAEEILDGSKSIKGVTFHKVAKTGLR